MKEKEEELIIIGKALRPHGLKGSLRVAPLTDVPDRLQKIKRVIIEGPDGRRTQATVVSARQDKSSVLMSFKEITSIEEAKPYVQGWIKIPQSEGVVLPKDQYYHYDLIGMDVSFEDGESLGVIESILETGSNDILVVRNNDDHETLIPAIRRVVKDVDVERRRMTLYRVEGLVEK